MDTVLIHASKQLCNLAVANDTAIPKDIQMINMDLK